jgi:hypothetical protein
VFWSSVCLVDGGGLRRVERAGYVGVSEALLD